MTKKLMCYSCKEEFKKLNAKLRKYKKLAIHDTLTGLYNRRKLEEDLYKYLDIKKRYKVNYLILMLDINKFKKINDTKGHKAGDKTLKKVAKILKKSIRNTDRVYRLSGDEFIIICPHSIKDRISFRIEELLLEENINISIGKSLLCGNILDIIDRKM